MAAAGSQNLLDHLRPAVLVGIGSVPREPIGETQKDVRRFQETTRSFRDSVSGLEHGLKSVVARATTMPEGSEREGALEATLAAIAAILRRMEAGKAQTPARQHGPHSDAIFRLLDSLLRAIAALEAARDELELLRRV